MTGYAGREAHGGTSASEPRGASRGQDGTGVEGRRSDCHWKSRRRVIQDAGAGIRRSRALKCGHCKRFIGALPSGGRQRNHCPYCLYSRHVDDKRPGDRASTCNALMAPIGAFQRPNGEHCIVHHCLGCGFERFNRIGADDDFDLVLSLPVVPSRSARGYAEESGHTDHSAEA